MTNWYPIALGMYKVRNEWLQAETAYRKACCDCDTARAEQDNVSSTPEPSQDSLTKTEVG